MSANEQFDAFVLGHERTHSALDLQIRTHEHLSYPGIEARIRALEDYRLQTQTVITLLKLVFGTSVLAAITGVISLLVLISHISAS